MKHKIFFMIMAGLLMTTAWSCRQESDALMGYDHNEKLVFGDAETSFAAKFKVLWNGMNQYYAIWDYEAENGVDWDAVVVNIIENPLSVRQAFWDPYRKVGKWINDKINKSATEKNDKAFADMTATADSATAQPKEAGAAVKSSFDIAKFAGIFAAIGMALGFLGSALASLVKGAVSIGPWKVLLVILAIMLVISGPAMFIAWRKLRRRDLGPLLNANGWAINAKSLVRVKFGRTLTSLAKYPKLTAVDKKARRRAWIRRIVWTLVILALGALTFCYFTGRLGKYSKPWPKKPAVEQVVPGTDSTLVNDTVSPSDTVSVAGQPDAPDAA